MAEEAKKTTKEATKETAPKAEAKTGAKTVYSKKQADRKKARPRKNDRPVDEFEQKIVDIARVTRVMAGGKRMRFRACVVIGNKKGKIGVGLDKGADVSIAVNKAVNKAKKNIVDVSIVNETIPHEVYYKLGAAKILFKPAAKGKGVISGGATRSILELSGIKNITTKNLGTNNAVNVAKCTIAALGDMRKVEVKSKKTDNRKQTTGKTEVKKTETKKTEKKANK